jgi:hypothetical protein
LAATKRRLPYYTEASAFIEGSVALHAAKKYDEAAERHKLVTLGDSTYAQADPAFGQVLPS